MTTDTLSSRPKTLREVAQGSKSLEDFGLNLRDWQHEIQRGNVHSKKELASRLAQAPARLAQRFRQGDVADAYLAAYAEWIADKADTARPAWCTEEDRYARDPWFSASDRDTLLVRTPASFRQRNLFTIPDTVFTPRRGRPCVSAEQKKEGARRRQRAYRAQIRELVKEARQARR
jgi:hypothetical protein